MNMANGELCKIKEEPETADYDFYAAPSELKTQIKVERTEPELHTTPAPIVLNGRGRKRSCSSSSPTADEDDIPIARLKMPKLQPMPKTSIALKVKCLCRLSGGQQNQMHTDETLRERQAEMRSFFEQMFQAARCLTSKQQRAVKQELLKAICEAEEYTEAGKCCERCCL